MVEIGISTGPEAAALGIASHPIFMAMGALGFTHLRRRPVGAVAGSDAVSDGLPQSQGLSDTLCLGTEVGAGGNSGHDDEILIGWP